MKRVNEILVSLSALIWLRSDLSGSYETNHTAMTNKSQHLPWLWDCSSLCPDASEQWACCCLTFTGAWQCWQPLKVRILHLERPGAPGGNESERESPCWRLFWGNHCFGVVGSIFWVLSSEQFWVTGCSNGWSLFAVLSCIWHTHKTSSVCLSRHETLHC